MVQEIIKISPGCPPDPGSPTSICPESFLAGDRYEGPVSVAEGVGQGEGQSGRPQHPYPSRDIREKVKSGGLLVQQPGGCQTEVVRVPSTKSNRPLSG